MKAASLGCMTAKQVTPFPTISAPAVDHSFDGEEAGFCHIFKFGLRVNGGQCKLDHRKTFDNNEAFPMQMTGEQRIAAPRKIVWDALNDPAILAACIPGCQSLNRTGDESFDAVAEVKIGPIGARFKGDVSLSDIVPASGYMITGKGSGGIAGNAKGSAKVRLSDDGAGTLISYEVYAEVGGRMAQLGGPIIDATAKQLAAKFFSKFGEVVGGNAPAPAVVPMAGAAPVGAVSGRSNNSAFPWTWTFALILAILAGFLVGRSGLADWWAIALALFALAAVGAGFAAGRGSGSRL